MKFQSPLDELQHYLGLLTVDVALGVAPRHLEATKRLCWLLVEQIEDRELRVDAEVFNRLQIQLLDLQRAIEASKPKAQASKPRPRLRLVST